MDFVLDILGLVLGPRGWRDSSGPAAAAGAICWTVVGAVAAAVSWAALARAEATTDRVFAWVGLATGILLLGDVLFGLIAFFRPNSERT